MAHIVVRVCRICDDYGGVSDMAYVVSSTDRIADGDDRIIDAGNNVLGVSSIGDGD